MESTYTTDELRNYFAWQLEQINPMLHRKNKDCWKGATVDTLMISPNALRTAIQTLDRAERRMQQAKDAGRSTDGIALWEDPLWREKMEAAEKAEQERQDQIAKEDSPFIVGGSR